MSLQQENERLRKELEDLSRKKSSESKELERLKDAELSQMKNNMAKLARQLDEEIVRKDHIVTKAHELERKVYDLGGGPEVVGRKAGGKGVAFDGDAEEEIDVSGPSSSQTSIKLMRIVESWMHTKDLQEVLLRNAAINDIAFSTVIQVLNDCNSLSLLDLGQNQLTMDSCSDLCRLVTTAPRLTFVSVAENNFSLRSIGYFMTAVLERQQSKKLALLNVFDLENNEGLVAAQTAPQQEDLLTRIRDTLGHRLPPKGAEVLAQVSKALWRFLHNTEHPQVAGTSESDVGFHLMDSATLRKMESALCKLLLMGEDNEAGQTVHANLVLLSLEGTTTTNVGTGAYACVPVTSEAAAGAQHSRSASEKKSDGTPGHGTGSVDADATGKGYNLSIAKAPPDGAILGVRAATAPEGAQRSRKLSVEQRDPFADLKMAFDPPKEKLRTFNLKQIVTRSGQVLMNMLERLLETTDVDAKDVETEVTLLEHACQTGNMGLAKLCYRRGANLAALTKRGTSYFNIATQNKNYPMMDFLCTYGATSKTPMKVNHQDAEGRTALHVAAGNDDVDAICRLIEWGADVNLYDYKRRTPLHTAARNGHWDATMLLLEVGADLNAKDEKEYTSVAHAEARNHFGLMDRLVELGGKGHGLSASKGLAKNASAPKQLGELSVTACILKSSSLGRLGKVNVKGMPGMLAPRPHTRA